MKMFKISCSILLMVSIFLFAWLKVTHGEIDHEHKMMLVCKRLNSAIISDEATATGFEVGPVLGDNLKLLKARARLSGRDYEFIESTSRSGCGFYIINKVPLQIGYYNHGIILKPLDMKPMIPQRAVAINEPNNTSTNDANSKK